MRGDSDWSSQVVMCEAERRGQPYLLKLRRAPQCQTGDAGKRFGRTPVPAGKGEWGEVGLLDWGRQRRVLLVRRRVRHSVRKC